MLIFDQLKRDDPAIRLVSLGVLAGLASLLAGLWWVQVVRGRDYQMHLENQSFRSVRIPAPRGKILDRKGIELANTRASYNVSLYLEELRKPFDAEYAAEYGALRKELTDRRAVREKQLGRKLTKTEAREFNVSSAQRTAMRQRARFVAASNIVTELSTRLQTPLTLDPRSLSNHYATRLALPFPVMKNLELPQIARFEEQFSGAAGVDLEMQSVRMYPFQTAAAHVLGYLRRDDSSVEGEEAFYSYRLPDYRGLIGVEGGFDEELRGHAGGKSVLVNNLGYKQKENLWQTTIPGDNAVLTLDIQLQQAAEQALSHAGANTRGAVVVMDTRNGDVLALASSPAFNPNHFVQGFPPGEWDRLHNEELRPEINRATQDNYQPGSIFKIMIGMAALELGLNPEASYTVEAYPGDPAHGGIRIGRRLIKDTAPPGPYNFRKAFAKSSNTFFIHFGLDPGVVEKVVELGRKLHLGERAGLPTRQENAGNFPKPEHLRAGWSDGDTANLCMGQAKIDVTPLQMAVMISAVANGGTVYWPRLVQRLEPQDRQALQPPTNFEAELVRDRLGVSARTLRVLHDAMLADTEDPEGTAYRAFQEYYRNGGKLRVGGKTGTAQVTNGRNQIVNHITWFASYGPWETPRYAVVVMVEGGRSGGGTCAPVAREIYEAIQKIERQPQAVAMTN